MIVNGAAQTFVQLNSNGLQFEVNLQRYTKIHTNNALS